MIREMGPSYVFLKRTYPQVLAYVGPLLEQQTQETEHEFEHLTNEHSRGRQEGSVVQSHMVGENNVERTVKGEHRNGSFAEATDEGV